MQTQGAASRSATMPLLALNRKDGGWRIDWQIKPLGLRFSQPNPETLLLWRYRDRRRYHPPPPHAIVVERPLYMPCCSAPPPPCSGTQVMFPLGSFTSQVLQR